MYTYINIVYKWRWNDMDVSISNGKFHGVNIQHIAKFLSNDGILSFNNPSAEWCGLDSWTSGYAWAKMPGASVRGYTSYSKPCFEGHS